MAYMKTSFFHGTTAENAKRILAGKPKGESTWICSQDQFLYLWGAEALAETEGNEDSELDEKKRFAIQRAFESAQVTACLSKKPCRELVVLEFEFEEQDLMHDHSCDNMNGAFRVSLETYRPHFVKAYSCKHNPRMDVFIVSMLLSRNLFNVNRLDFDMREAAKMVEKADLGYVWEVLSSFDWKEKSI
jgi:hypothetical protein